jgi:hypothetical protein
MRATFYWITTGVLILAIGSGGAADLAHPPEVISGMTHLGYPGYFVTLLGTWKVLGAIALLVPGFPGSRNGLTPESSST